MMLWMCKVLSLSLLDEFRTSNAVAEEQKEKEDEEEEVIVFFLKHMPIPPQPVLL